MKYLVNLISSTTGRSRFTKVEAKDIKDAERQTKEIFPNYIIQRICDDVDHNGYYSTVSRMRRKDEQI